MRNRRRLALWTGALVVLAFAPALAEEARLVERLGAETAGEITKIVESARAASLPTESLVAAALEGAAKRAPASRIIETVRRRAEALGQAREALGRASTSAELAAGAGAILAGVPADTLARLRAMRPQASLVVPLVVVADLIARRVPETTASAAVIQAARLGIRDRDLLRARERVEQDIRAGRTPTAAIEARGRALGMAFPSATDHHRPARPNGGTP